MYLLFDALATQRADDLGQGLRSMDRAMTSRMVSMRDSGMGLLPELPDLQGQ